MYSHGKPVRIEEIEWMLWHCIIGIAWCRWDSEVGLKTFLEKVRPLVTGYEEDEWEEENWFSKAVTYAEKKPIEGFEVRLAKENQDWLADNQDFSGYPDNYLACH